MKIPLFYAVGHTRHAPPVEFVHGQLVAYLEKPERIERIKAHLEQSGLVESHEPVRALSMQDLERVHAPEMLHFFEQFSHRVEQVALEEIRSYSTAPQTATPYYYAHTFPVNRVMGRLGKNAMAKLGKYAFDLSVPFGRHTWDAAVDSANLAFAGAEYLLRGESRVAYALCRPPGHHAGPDFIGGYCFLNNAAAAARKLLETGRVAILDIDYHHGNGTQAIFWDEPEVLFVSLHAQPQDDYPYYSGYADETGGPDAPHTTVNLPLPPGTDDAPYLAAVETAITHIAQFAPRWLIVSAGLDTFEGDPLCAFRLSPSAYTRIGQAIRSLDLPTLLVQEGGYATDALGGLVENLLRGIAE